MKRIIAIAALVCLIFGSFSVNVYAADNDAIVNAIEKSNKAAQRYIDAALEILGDDVGKIIDKDDVFVCEYRKFYNTYKNFQYDIVFPITGTDERYIVFISSDLDERPYHEVYRCPNERCSLFYRDPSVEQLSEYISNNNLPDPDEVTVVIQKEAMELIMYRLKCSGKTYYIPYFFYKVKNCPVLRPACVNCHMGNGYRYFFLCNAMIFGIL